MKNLYDLIMDPKRNPLRHVHPAQRFQIMLMLSIMWTTIFTAAIGIWFAYGALLVGHALVLIGIAVTAHVFRRYSKENGTYRDYPREDGTARYDDVWGG